MEPGDEVEFYWRGARKKGVFIKEEGKYLIFKLENGYNVGFPKDEIENIKIISKRHVGKPKFHYKPEFREDLPLVGLAATGGTISARVDYITGAVTSEFTVEDLVNTFPEMREVARPKLKQISNIFSENMVPSLWKDIAREIYDLLKETEGVVVTHGTDTMHYTSSYLSFAIETGKPVVLTGAQRSSDRPSSDAAYNLISSLYVAGHSPLGGVFVCMHASSSDGRNAVHLGTRVRKMHTSRRDTFQSIGRDPVAFVDLEMRKGKIDRIDLEVLDPSFSRGDKLNLRNYVNENVGLVKYYPGMKREIFERFLFSHEGVIIEGTGFGHIREELIPIIEQATHSNVFVGITSQTIWGRTHPHVYSTAVRMAEAGAVFLEDMLPETAFAKLVWVMGFEKDLEKIKEHMLTNYAGEITERSGITWISSL